MGLRHLVIIFSVASFAVGCSSSGEKRKAELHLRIGTGYLTKGSYPQALRQLLLAESLDSSSAVIQNNLALAYYARGDKESSKKHLENALLLQPDYADAKNNLGKILIDLKEFDRAILTLKDVKSDLTYPHPEKVFLNLGLAYFRQKRYKAAKDEFVRAVKIKRSFCLAHSYYGQSLFYMKKFEEATVALDAAMQFCKKHDKTHYFNALAYYYSGRSEIAKTRFEEVLALYPESRYAKKAKKALSTITQ